MNSEYLGRSVLPCVAVVDEDGVICSVNDGWKEFARANGYEGERYGVGDRYFSHCVTKDTQDLQSIFSDIMLGRREKFQLEYPCHSPTEERWYLMEMMSLPMPTGTYGLISHANITLAKRLHDELHERNERLKRFAAIAAHDLRGPLRKARQLIEIAKSDMISDGEYKANAENLDRGLQNIVEMQKLLDNYINHFLISSTHALKEPVKLRQLGVELCLANPRFEDVRIICSLPDIEVQLEKTKLEIVLRNLLSNACKFSKPENAVVEIGANVVENCLKIFVEDNGIGMSENVKMQIFDIAYSTHVDEEGASSGLGLSVVRDIVDSVEGSIKLYTEAGKGSRFEITWPL